MGKMNILFICKYNMGRSRMAELIFNKLTKKHHAKSCGVYTYYYLKKYHAKMPEGDPVIKVMKEKGMDASKELIKQINRSMVKNADVVIAIMTKERVNKDLPNYVKNSKKFRFWEIKDISGAIKVDSQYEKHKRNRDKIEVLVKKLIKEIK